MKSWLLNWWFEKRDLREKVKSLSEENSKLSAKNDSKANVIAKLVGEKSELQKDIIEAASKFSECKDELKLVRAEKNTLSVQKAILETKLNIAQ